MLRLQSIERMRTEELKRSERSDVSNVAKRSHRQAAKYGGPREEWGRPQIRPVADIPRRGDFRMRGFLLAMVVAAGIGLVGSAGVSAAPINGAAIGNAASEASPVTTVQHWRWGSGGHW